LDLALLCDFLADVVQEGYQVLAISGGEPLLYKSLHSLLLHAQQYGLKTTITTNGMLLDDRRLEQIKGVVDLIAISLDGVPESHNRMRASKYAFPKMAANLERLRSSGIPFGFIFTLTQYNLNELEWVAQFALEQGASLLQVHPLENAGRAMDMLQGEVPDTIESLFAFLEAARIQAAANNKMRIQIDILTRQFLRENPKRFYSELLPADDDSKKLSELISPLVLEDDGTVVPLLFGFSREYQLGNLNQEPLRKMAPKWRQEKLDKFQILCKSVYQRETATDENAFFNWYEAMAQSAELI